jgi:hypothetical protein
MKRLTILALFVSALTMGAFARGKQPVVFDKLPAAVQEEVQKNFAPADAQLITSKKVAPKKLEYEFLFNDGTELKYSNKAQLISVENKQGVKAALVPEKIQAYVQETFPNATITGYKVSTSKKEIELNDEMELVFSKKDKFLRIDD